MRCSRLWLPLSLLLPASGVVADIDKPLENTHWRLVQIQSMDDTVTDPDPDIAVGLSFGARGEVWATAGCARIEGNWSFEPPSGLIIDIPANAAEQMPAAAASVFTRQLPWVRSGLMQQGRLFLATMADGSIIELAPVNADPVGAVVFGNSLSASDARELQELVLTRVFAQYAIEEGIQASEEEVASLVADFVRTMESDTAIEHESVAALSEEERLQLAGMRRAMADSIITRWKIGRALYREYGGRIIYQQLGPEPLDAYRQYLQGLQQSGALTLCDDDAADYFWGYFTDEQRHSFMASGSDDEKNAFSVPPWAQL